MEGLSYSISLSIAMKAKPETDEEDNNDEI